MSYEDLVKYGSEKAVKEAGRLREEGKEYIVQDGDIMDFLILQVIWSFIFPFKSQKGWNFFPT